MVELTELVIIYGWNHIADYADMLSIGQQQRIGLARLLYHHVITHLFTHAGWV